MKTEALILTHRAVHPGTNMFHSIDQEQFPGIGFWGCLVWMYISFVNAQTTDSNLSRLSLSKPSLLSSTQISTNSLSTTCCVLPEETSLRKVCFQVMWSAASSILGHKGSVDNALCQGLCKVSSPAAILF